jgi:hypothetical protein
MRTFGLRSLRPFVSSVSALFEALRGTAVFHPLEPWLLLTLTGDAKGHIELAAEGIDHVGWGNRLSFKYLELDQSFFAAFDRPGS